MVDTNIIISASLFPETVVGMVFTHILKNNQLVLSQYTLDELKKVFQKKFPKRIEFLNIFLEKLKYEHVDIKIKDPKNYPQIRDIKDTPLLAHAIESKVHILVTGDKDFKEIIVKDLKIINPRKYIEEYVN